MSRKSRPRKAAYEQGFKREEGIIRGKFLLFFSSSARAVIRNLLENIGWCHAVAFSLVNSFFAGVVALLLATFAANKIEDFAYLKAGGIVILIPLLSLLGFFADWKQYLLGIFTNFWPIKAMLNVMMLDDHPANLNFYLYMLVCLAYMMGLAAFSFALMRRKLEAVGK